jgi:hypothetical protein
MKTFKIILAAVAIAAIATSIYLWIAKLTPPPTPPLPINQFTQLIEQEIDSLGKLPKSKFCKDFYETVTYHIDDFYKDNRFSNIPSENEQWKDNLSQTLYSTYADKFISQAFYVFSGQEWKPADLQFIRRECQHLQKSPLLQPVSTVNTTLSRILQILDKYGEISSFIASCKRFSYSTTNISDSFPTSDVTAMISQSKAYLNEHSYVNNCTRLHENLQKIPQTLFRAHIRYLNNKIKNWTRLYSNYSSQKEYKELLYDKLKADIGLLYNDSYNVSDSILDIEYIKLKDKLDADSRNAYDYFNRY